MSKSDEYYTPPKIDPSDLAPVQLVAGGADLPYLDAQAVRDVLEVYSDVEVDALIEGVEDDLDLAVDDLQGQIDDIVLEVSNLGGTTTIIEGDILTIQGDILTIQGDINTIQNDISDLSDGLDALTLVVNNLSSGDIDNTSTVNGGTGSVTDALDDLASQVSSLLDGIGDFLRVTLHLPLALPGSTTDSLVEWNTQDLDAPTPALRGSSISWSSGSPGDIVIAEDGVYTISYWVWITDQAGASNADADRLCIGFVRSYLNGSGASQARYQGNAVYLRLDASDISSTETSPVSVGARVEVTETLELSSGDVYNVRVQPNRTGIQVNRARLCITRIR